MTSLKQQARRFRQRRTQAAAKASLAALFAGASEDDDVLDGSIVDTMGDVRGTDVSFVTVDRLLRSPVVRDAVRASAARFVKLLKEQAKRQ